jgi:hypothetical protein
MDWNASRVYVYCRCDGCSHTYKSVYEPFGNVSHWPWCLVGDWWSRHGRCWYRRRSVRKYVCKIYVDIYAVVWCGWCTDVREPYDYAQFVIFGFGICSIL